MGKKKNISLRNECVDIINRCIENIQYSYMIEIQLYKRINDYVCRIIQHILCIFLKHEIF